MRLFENLKNYLREFLVDWLFQKDLKTMDGISLNKIFYCHILPKIEEYSSEMLPLMKLLCMDHDESYINFDTGRYKYERLSEGEMPKERKIIWGKRQRDAEKFGHNIGYTWDWLLSEQASRKNTMARLGQAIERDKALLLSLMLETCLVSSANGFYNGEFEKMEEMDRPPKNEFKGITFEKDHSHYLAFAKKELDQEIIDETLTHIKHHFPWDIFLLFCNSDMKTRIKCFASRNKPKKEKVNGQIIDDYVGKILSKDDLEIACIQLNWMPDNYFLVIGTSQGRRKPLMFIQKRNPAAKGLILEPGRRPDYPIIDSVFIRFLTFRVLERGAGVGLFLGQKWKNPEITGHIIDYDC